LSVYRGQQMANIAGFLSLTGEWSKYHSCTTAFLKRPWCSLETVYKGKWGYCGKCVLHLTCVTLFVDFRTSVTCVLTTSLLMFLYCLWDLWEKLLTLCWKDSLKTSSSRFLLLMWLVTNWSCVARTFDFEITHPITPLIINMQKF